MPGSNAAAADRHPHQGDTTMKAWLVPPILVPIGLGLIVLVYAVFRTSS